jgi:hypothetical protein
LPDQGRRVDARRVQRQVAVLQPAHQQQVVDQGQHALGVAPNRGKRQRTVARCEIVDVEAFGERGDRGERGTQLMGDDGQETCLEGGRHRILADRPVREISTLNYNCP